MAIKYFLIDNPLTPNPRDRSAIIQTMGCKTMQDIIDETAAYGSALTKPDLMAITETLFHVMAKLVAEGYTLSAPMFNVSPSIRGVFKAETSGEVSISSIEAGKHIVGRFEIGMDEFEKSWTGLYVWMNEQGYKKADRAPFEIYHNNMHEHPEKKSIVDICIPIE